MRRAVGYLDPIEGEPGADLIEGAEADPGLEDEPFEVPEPPVTGDPAVDDAVRRVAEVIGQPLDVEVTAYDAVHRALQDRLADVED